MKNTGFLPLSDGIFNIYDRSSFQVQQSFLKLVRFGGNVEFGWIFCSEPVKKTAEKSNFDNIRNANEKYRIFTTFR